MTRTGFAFLLAWIPALVSAQVIYKCVDANGGTLIANARLDKSCRAIDSGPENVVPAPKARPSAATTPSPSGFPKVQEDTQKARDNDRRHILEQELGAEQRSLEQARKEVAEQEALRAGPDRVAPYRDRVGQHERNIQAIQKELGNLK